MDFAGPTEARLDKNGCLVNQNVLVKIRFGCDPENQTNRANAYRLWSWRFCPWPAWIGAASQNHVAGRMAAASLKIRNRFQINGVTIDQRFGHADRIEVACSHSLDNVIVHGKNKTSYISDKTEGRQRL